MATPNPGEDRLLDHYSAKGVEGGHYPDTGYARAVLDVHPSMQGLLGREGGRPGHLNALALAGIITAEEQRERARLISRDLG